MQLVFYSIIKDTMYQESAYFNIKYKVVYLNTKKQYQTLRLAKNRYTEKAKLNLLIYFNYRWR